MASKIRLRIITPQRAMFDEEAENVIMRTTEGDLGVLAGHAPLTTTLDYGVLKIEKGGGLDPQHAAIFGGFVEIGPEMTTILTDAAEWPDEVDLERAKEAKERAEKRLSDSSEAYDTERALLALRRALVRLEIAKFHPKNYLE